MKVFLLRGTKSIGITSKKHPRPRASVPDPAAAPALSEWIEANIRLPEGVSALPGAVRLWPYQREIADAISDPAIERVTLVKPVRVGFTTLLTGAIGTFVANEPAPILVLLPTESDCRDYVVTDIEPMFAASPALRGSLSADVEEGERNTLLSRRFPGGTLKIVAAKAPRNLRRHTARILIVDEADACEIGAEGNPIRLAERRTLSFREPQNHHRLNAAFRRHVACAARLRRKRRAGFRGAVPRVRRLHRNHVAAYRMAARPARNRGVPLPALQGADRRTAQAAMVTAGPLARDAARGHSGHAGFRLNALVSLLANASWGKLAAEFIAAKDDPAELQTFVNTILAKAGAKPVPRSTKRRCNRAPSRSASTPSPPKCWSSPPASTCRTTGSKSPSPAGRATGECLVLGHVVIWGIARR